MKTNLALEQAYQKHDLEKASGRVPPERINVDKMEVCILVMHIYIHSQ